MNATALNTVIRYATENIDGRPTAQQVELYNALSQVLPSPDRITAGRVAFAIQETAKLQTDFLSALSEETNSK